MDWDEESRLDVEMFEHLHVEPLDEALANGDEHLVEEVRAHNEGLARLKARFADLAASRKTLADNRNWRDAESRTLRDERQRIADEGWDAALAVRTTLRDRAALLGRLKEHLDSQWSALVTERSECVAKASRALSKQHAGYLRTDPVAGQAYVERLAEADPSVTALDSQMKALGALIEQVSSALYLAQSDERATNRRQYELHAVMVN